MYVYIGKKRTQSKIKIIMAVSKKHFTTNSRILHDHLSKYKNTFYALCELITNSIQANAKVIDLTIDYSKNQLSASPINYIKIVDDGHGVAQSEFEDKIMDIGTISKKDGHGIGRFGALQIGSTIEIETIAWDSPSEKFWKIILPVNSEEFKHRKLNTIDLVAEESELSGKHTPRYSVTITNLYHNRQEKPPKRNLISNELLEENIRLALFEKYPYQIFNETVRFIVNGQKLERKEFIKANPIVKKEKYIDVKGTEHNMDFYFYNINLNSPKAKVFFQVDNSGVKTVAHEFTFTSDWYTPQSGAWYIYVDSPIFNSDLFRNLDIDTLGHDEIASVKLFVRDIINSFFVDRNERFIEFSEKLNKDLAYPYKDVSSVSTTTISIFEKVAFLVEDQYKLLEKDNKIKNLVYPLIDAAIKDGNIQEIFDHILKLDKTTIEKFHDLLKKTSLSNVIQFSHQVATKIEFLDFLYELTYGDISKNIRERNQLHKILENQLWLFGESYNGAPHLWSDNKIGRIFEEIRKSHVDYKPTTEDENLIPLTGKGLNDITDLFFTNEKIMDDGKKEYMIVELKAPKCAISQKELNQIDRYSSTIEKQASLPSNNVRYKLILISSKLTDFAESKLETQSKAFRTPFMFDKKEKKSIEVYVMSWSELIEQNRRKLGYLTEQLKVKERAASEKFESEYPTLVSAKSKARLTKVK